MPSLLVLEKEASIPPCLDNHKNKIDESNFGDWLSLGFLKKWPSNLTDFYSMDQIHTSLFSVSQI